MNLNFKNKFSYYLPFLIINVILLILFFLIVNVCYRIHSEIRQEKQLSTRNISNIIQNQIKNEIQAQTLLSSDSDKSLKNQINDEVLAKKKLSPVSDSFDVGNPSPGSGVPPFNFEVINGVKHHHYIVPDSEFDSNTGNV